jgi:membrane associated rhomboid family serine protease
MRSYDRPVDAPRLYLVEEGQSKANVADEESDRSLPPVTMALTLVIVVVFLWMEAVSHGNVGMAARSFGAKDPELIRAGEWQRLILPIFLHGSWIHLIMNGLTLVWFGSQMERLYGSRRFFLIYMVSGIVGFMLSAMMLPGISLGASGSLFGLIGAGLVFPLRFRRLLPVKEREAILKQLVAVTAINMALSFSPGIDKYAHFGGFIGGGVMALFLIPVVLDERPRNRVREAALTLAAIFMVGLTLCAAAKQWNTVRAVKETVTVSYGPTGADAWWRLELGTNWKPISEKTPGITWLGPGNARINAVDSVANPDLYEATDQWRAEVEPTTVATRIDGQPANLMTAQAPGEITELCQITAFQRVLNIALVCPPESYQTAGKEFHEMLNRIRLTPPHTP